MLEQHSNVGAGTSWHAAGLVGKMRATSAETALSSMAAELYPRLEQETGQATGWRQFGSISVARTAARMTIFERTLAKARAYGVDATLLSTEEARTKFPLMDTRDLLGALWLPEDGSINVGLTHGLCLDIFF